MLNSKGALIGFKISGTVSVETLTSTIVETSGTIKYPGITQIARKWIKDKHIDFESVVKAGLVSMKLTFFPRIGKYDTNRQERASWNGSHLLEITTTGTNASLAAQAADIASNLVTYLETHGLSWRCNMRNVDLSWLENVLLKVQHLNLSAEHTERVCAFVVCLALMHLNIYVDYNKLSQLMQKLPVTQNQLQECLILSNIIHTNFNVCKLFKLHTSLRCLITKNENLGKGGKKASHNKVTSSHIEVSSRHLGMIEQPDDMPSEHHEDNAEQDVRPYHSSHLPVTNKGQYWSEIEVQQILHAIDRGNTNKEVYKIYLTLCKEHNIPDRSYDAFRKKLNRILKTV